MMRVIKKWKIVVFLVHPNKIEFSISDDHYSNVLSHLAKMDFGRVVTMITVGEEKYDVKQTIATDTVQFNPNDYITPTERTKQ